MADNKNNQMNKEEKGRMDGKGTAKNQDKELNQENGEKAGKSSSSKRNQE